MEGFEAEGGCDMNKVKVNSEVLYCPIYGVSILVIWGCTFKKFEQYCRQEIGMDDFNINGSDEWVGGVWQYSDADSGLCLMLWMKKTNDLSTLVHELAHLVIPIFESRCIPITPANEETFAYYQQFLFNEITGFMKKKGAAKK